MSLAAFCPMTMCDVTPPDECCRLVHRRLRTRRTRKEMQKPNANAKTMKAAERAPSPAVIALSLSLDVQYLKVRDACTYRTGSCHRSAVVSIQTGSERAALEPKTPTRGHQRGCCSLRMEVEERLDRKTDSPCRGRLSSISLRRRRTYPACTLMAFSWRLSINRAG